LTVWEAKPSSTFVSVFTCEFAENAKVMQRTPTPDRLPGMRGQPLRETMFDSPSMMAFLLEVAFPWIMEAIVVLEPSLPEQPTRGTGLSRHFEPPPSVCGTSGVAPDVRNT
jgi:hypothetical protein